MCDAKRSGRKGKAAIARVYYNYNTYNQIPGIYYLYLRLYDLLNMQRFATL